MHKVVFGGGVSRGWVDMHSLKDLGIHRIDNGCNVGLSRYNQTRLWAVIYSTSSLNTALVTMYEARY